MSLVCQVAFLALLASFSQANPLHLASEFKKLEGINLPSYEILSLPKLESRPAPVNFEFSRLFLFSKET